MSCFAPARGLDPIRNHAVAQDGEPFERHARKRIFYPEGSGDESPLARLLELRGLESIEPEVTSEDALETLSGVCQECGESFRIEEMVGRLNADDELCQHCYEKHYE
jgi:hypothetical protein